MRHTTLVIVLLFLCADGHLTSATTSRSGGGQKDVEGGELVTACAGENATATCFGHTVIEVVSAHLTPEVKRCEGYKIFKMASVNSKRLSSGGCDTDISSELQAVCKGRRECVVSATNLTSMYGVSCEGVTQNVAVRIACKWSSLFSNEALPRYNEDTFWAFGDPTFYNSPCSVLHMALYTISHVVSIAFMHVWLNYEFNRRGVHDSLPDSTDKLGMIALAMSFLYATAVTICMFTTLGVKHSGPPSEAAPARRRILFLWCVAFIHLFVFGIADRPVDMSKIHVDGMYYTDPQLMQLVMIEKDRLAVEAERAASHSEGEGGNETKTKKRKRTPTETRLDTAMKTNPNRGENQPDMDKLWAGINPHMVPPILVEGEAPLDATKLFPDLSALYDQADDGHCSKAIGWARVQATILAQAPTPTPPPDKPKLTGVVGGAQCDDVVVVSHRGDCNPSPPENDEDGMVCANDGDVNEAYCSFEVGPTVCAYCRLAGNDTAAADGEGETLSWWERKGLKNPFRKKDDTPSQGEDPEAVASSSAASASESGNDTVSSLLQMELAESDSGDDALIPEDLKLDSPAQNVRRETNHQALVPARLGVSEQETGKDSGGMFAPFIDDARDLHAMGKSMTDGLVEELPSKEQLLDLTTDARSSINANIPDRDMVATTMSHLHARISNVSRSSMETIFSSAGSEADSDKEDADLQAGQQSNLEEERTDGGGQEGELEEEKEGEKLAAERQDDMIDRMKLLSRTFPRPTENEIINEWNATSGTYVEQTIFNTESQVVGAHACILKSFLQGRMIGSDQEGKDGAVEKDMATLKFEQRCFKNSNKPTECVKTFTFLEHRHACYQCQTVPHFRAGGPPSCRPSRQTVPMLFKESCNEVNTQTDCTPRFYTYVKKKNMHYACEWAVGAQGTWGCVANMNWFVNPGLEDEEATGKDKIKNQKMVFAAEKQTVKAVLKESPESLQAKVIDWYTDMSGKAQMGLVGTVVFWLLVNSPMPQRPLQLGF